LNIAFPTSTKFVCAKSICLKNEIIACQAPVVSTKRNNFIILLVEDMKTNYMWPHIMAVVLGIQDRKIATDGPWLMSTLFG
jgi:hypothetical protein